MNYKTSFQWTLAATALVVGLLGCSQENHADTSDAQSGAKSGAQSGVQADAKPEAASAHSDAAPHHAEPTAADWKAKLQVKMALLEKLGTDSLRVDVSSQGGTVGLSGVVEKRETKELAESIAQSVTGVTSVRNDIGLEASVDNPNKAGVVAGEAEAELKDAMLATKVRLALVDGLGSDGFRIGTEVANGVVTLEFAPELAPARRSEAAVAAKNVEGVDKVISVEKT